MSSRRVTALAAVLLFGLCSALLTEATARQSHGGGARAAGGHNGGGHASFTARSGAAHAAAHISSGAAVRFIASAAQSGYRARGGTGPAFAGVAPQRFNAHSFNTHTGMNHVHYRHHRRSYGYVAAIGIPLVSYGYVTNAYRPCAWLKARYEETGLRKWRLRYETCRDGDDN